jgi:hypothetical protein
MRAGLDFLSYSRPARPFHPVALHPHLHSASLSRLCHLAEPFLRGSQQAEHGTGGRGEQRTSHAVHRRFVFPAAMAGVRCR